MTDHLKMSLEGVSCVTLELRGKVEIKVYMNGGRGKRGGLRKQQHYTHNSMYSQIHKVRTSSMKLALQ